MRTLAMVLTALAATASFASGADAGAPGAHQQSAPGVGGGSCNFATTEIATASSFDQSTSANFVKLANAGSVTFTQNRTGCVAGTFFANAGNGDDGDHVLLQVLLDGAPCVPLTASYIFANSGTDLSSHSAAFFCGARIAPGRHVVLVQYASGLGGPAEIFQRTLEVTHQ
jgi:hypothetical protein